MEEEKFTTAKRRDKNEASWSKMLLCMYVHMYIIPKMNPRTPLRPRRYARPNEGGFENLSAAICNKNRTSLSYCNSCCCSSCYSPFATGCNKHWTNSERWTFRLPNWRWQQLSRWVSGNCKKVDDVVKETL